MSGDLKGHSKAPRRFINLPEHSPLILKLNIQNPKFLCLVTLKAILKRQDALLTCLNTLH